MSEIDISNAGFSKIQDTVYDSKLMEGLANLGVFPSLFKVYVSTVDLEGLAIGAAVIQPLVDDHSGNQIVFTQGQKVAFLSAGASVPVATEANLDLFQVGLAATASGAVAETLSDAGTGELLNAAGVGSTFSVNGGVVGATNVYGVISTTVTTLALTAGVVKIVMVVV